MSEEQAMDIQKLINEYRRRAMSPDDAGGVRVGALGLLQILDALESSPAPLQPRSRENFIALCNQLWNWTEFDDINVDEEPRLGWDGSAFTHRVTRALWMMYQAAPPDPFAKLIHFDDGTTDVVRIRYPNQCDFDKNDWKNEPNGLELFTRAAPPAPFVVDSKSFERGLFILNETLDDCGDSERGLLLALTKMGVEVADE